MCGIFGLISSENWEKESFVSVINELFELSEKRGKEASGLCINYGNRISLIKDKVQASELISQPNYKNFIDDILPENGIGNFFAFGHSRLVTNGTEELNTNNQPVEKDGFVVIHNGICTNVDELYSKHHDLKRLYEIDTEIFPTLLRKYLNEGKSIIEAINIIYNEFEGTASLAMTAKNLDEFILTTNNGSLYTIVSNNGKSFVFASEQFILGEFIKNNQQFSKAVINWIEPYKCLLINNKLDIEEYDVRNNNINKNALNSEKKFIKDYSNFDKPNFNRINLKNLENQLHYNIELLSSLTRCKKCLLPSTFPNLFFDNEGVCSICNNYIKKNQGLAEDELKRSVEKYKSKNGKPDCIIAFSGGRDSSYGMHYIVNELGLKPITYTYDWGMVTDLARRNIARICGKLNIENILVSADIRMKRRNISLNVAAWLKRPELGMIPLFMAGDKHFFHFMNKIKEENDLKLNIWSMNRLENTDFKSGFCGVKHSADKKRIDYLSTANKITMASYYLRNFIMNPDYINASIPDTFSSFYSYYAEPRNDYFELFDYIAWDEKTIEDTIINEYNWETAPDTKSTWRIGDGTAPFYNYIYLTVAGFSENDTFRSNQIREGMITREQGMELIMRDNAPRYESMKWYFDTIGVDMESALKVINNIPKLYEL